MAPTRRLAGAHHYVFTRGDLLVVRFTVLGSKFGPVEIEMDTGEAGALAQDIWDTIDELDDAAVAEMDRNA